jgi:hypothetical protein
MKWSGRKPLLSAGGSEHRAQRIASVGIIDLYCQRQACRHRQLVEHFGQAYSPPTDAAGYPLRKGCGACDVCAASRGLQSARTSGSPTP